MWISVLNLVLRAYIFDNSVQVEALQLKTQHSKLILLYFIHL